MKQQMDTSSPLSIPDYPIPPTHPGLSKNQTGIRTKNQHGNKETPSARPTMGLRPHHGQSYHLDNTPPLTHIPHPGQTAITIPLQHKPSYHLGLLTARPPPWPILSPHPQKSSGTQDADLGKGLGFFLFFMDIYLSLTSPTESLLYHNTAPLSHFDL